MNELVDLCSDKIEAYPSAEIPFDCSYRKILHPFLLSVEKLLLSFKAIETPERWTTRIIPYLLLYLKRVQGSMTKASMIPVPQALSKERGQVRRRRRR